MRLLRDESDQAAERMADVNRAFEPAPGEQAAAWERLQLAMQLRWDADRTRAERRHARRAGWRLLFGATAVAALALIVWVAVRPRAPEGIARAPIARDVVRAVPRVGAAYVRAGLPTRPTTPAPIEQPLPTPPPVALAPGRSWLAVGVRARLAPRAAAMVRSGAVPASRVVSLLRGRLDIDIVAAPPARAPVRSAVAQAQRRRRVRRHRRRRRESRCKWPRIDSSPIPIRGDSVSARTATRSTSSCIAESWRSGRRAACWQQWWPASAGPTSGRAARVGCRRQAATTAFAPRRPVWPRPQ